MVVDPSSNNNGDSVNVPRASNTDSLLRLAWANVAVHVAALALAGIGMRPGSPLAPLDERLAYLATAPLAWTVNWLVWMGCAVALIAYLYVLARRLGPDAGLASLGLMIAIAGAGFDLFCDLFFMLILPALAAARLPEQTLFLLAERATGIGSLVIANGAYSVAMLLFTLALRDRPEVGSVTTATGWTVAICGLILAAAGFTGNPWHAALATPPTIGLFCVWVVLVARSLAPRVPS